MIGSILIYGVLNVVLCLVCGPLFEGVSRKYVKANIAHGRKGPLTGALQPFWDIAKLMGKEDLETGGMLQRLAPILCMASVLTAAILTPVGGQPPFEFAGDFIVLLYFLSLASIAIMLGAMAGGTSYTMTGGLREIMTLLLVDLVVAVSFLTVMIHTRTLRIGEWLVWQASMGPSLSMFLAAIPILLILPAQFGKIPFDIPEADQELMGGPFAEMSGRKLAIFKWALYAKQFVVSALFVQVFIPWPVIGIPAIDVVLTVVKILIVFILVGVIEVLMPRLKINQALHYYASLFVIGAMAIVMAYLGA
jgi:formate hydrogenlyase subunit 4